MNQLSLIGNLTKDPELRYLPDGRPVCDLRIAVNGVSDTAPLYLDVATFGPQAEACSRWLQKGRQVGFNGKLAFREWTATDGSRRSRHSGVGRIEFLGIPADGEIVPGDEDDASLAAVIASARGDQVPA